MLNIVKRKVEGQETVGVLGMLEKLSSALKKTTDKIANAIFLDKAQVEAIVKDLQRALIEADVNI